MGTATTAGIVRAVTRDDLEALVDLETRAMHFPMGHRVREWFREDHPSVRPEHFRVGEVDGRIVAAAALLPRPADYRGVRLSLGEWEAVVTDEACRRQGWCRRLFDALAAATDHDLLIVRGLTWVYRQFGYHPALQSIGGWDAGGRTARAEELPESPLTARPATPDDAAFVVATRAAAARRSVLTCPASEAEWRHALRPDRTVVGPGGTTLNRWQEVRVLENAGRPVGYFIHDPWDLARLVEIEIVPGAATWRDAGATAGRATAAFAKAADVKAALADHHPLFAAFPRTFARSFRGYGDWGVRISDPGRFLTRIAPVLERHLAESAMAGWTGEFSLSRVEDAVTLRFENGRFAGAGPWDGTRADRATVRLMPGRFEALVLGYRSLEATLAVDADCAVSDEAAAAVLAAVFPAGGSSFRSI